MRIIYATTSIVPSRLANSVHIMKMCQAFRQLGNEIELVIPNFPHLEDIQQGVNLWTHYGIRDPFPIHRIRWSKPIAGLDFAYSACRYALQKQAQLLYTRNLQVAAMASMRGLPTVVERHAPVVSPLRWRVFRSFAIDARPVSVPLGFLDDVSFKVALWGPGFRKLVVITNVLKQLVMEHTNGRLKSENILVCPDGIDLERFEQMPDAPTARARLGLPEGALTLGYAGNLYEGFGTDLLFRLARSLPQFMFVFIGGHEKHIVHWQNEKAQKGIENVHFFGFVPNAVLPNYLAACDVLLMPYQRRVTILGKGDTSLWMSPMKMFEYMATGRLIISSDLPVLREVLNERNAVLCPPDDLDAWRLAAERAACDPRWRASLGEQARADVEKYSWKRRVEKILAEARNLGVV